VDILIEFQKGKSFFDLVSLERELRIKLGTKVDVLTYDSINHLLKKQILAEEVKIL
jgi:predicted nucleotidyltransferase